MSNPHLIHAIETKPEHPSIFFFCCTHGNEVAGHQALDQLFEHLYDMREHIKANLYAVLGNLKAYQERTRYLDKDLNRIWTRENLLIKEADNDPVHEISELRSIYRLITDKARDKRGELYFIDLHTTSSSSKPFIVMNDSLKNIQFTASLGMSVVIGVERFIRGSMLDFFNSRGYVSFAFEGGRHDEKDAVYAIEDLCLKVLIKTQALSKKNAERMSNPTSLHPSKFYEIRYRHKLDAQDEFYMINVYRNFQPIRKGEKLALHNQRIIKSPDDYTIFMPLYQDQGEDGFFFIKPITYLRLKIISMLRKSSLQERLIPKDNVVQSDRNTLIIDKIGIKGYQLKLLHLLGFRKRKNINGKKAIYKRNERYPQAVKDWLS